MKQRRSYLCALLFGALFTSAIQGCSPDDQPEPSPEPTDTLSIKITETGDIEAAPEGGRYTVSYQTTGGTNGDISAAISEGCDWITGIDTRSEGTVAFEIAANETGKERRAVLTVICTGGERQASDEIGIFQTSLPVTYDYEVQATVLTGTWYGTKFGLNGEDNYYIWLSDLPFIDGHNQAGGTYYLFDMYACAPSDPESPMPPTGSYTLGAPGLTSMMTFSPDLSKGISFGDYQQGQDVIVDYEATFSEGTLTVSSDDNVTYTFEAVLTDTEGKSHHVTYTGKDFCENESGSGVTPDPDVPTIDYDIDFETVTAFATYVSDLEGVMEVTIRLTDTAEDSYGDQIRPCTTLTIETFMPYDDNGRITPGVYKIGDTYGENSTIRPGEVLNVLGWIMPSGTYVTYYADYNDIGTYGAITEGTMVIGENGGRYDITCRFSTREGHSVECSYSGALTVANIPKAYSTLTDDYTLDLSQAGCQAYNYGDFYYTGGNNYVLYIRPLDGVTGDGMQIEIVTDLSASSNGIPTGTYTSAAGADPYPWQYATGYLYNGSIYGTNYLGGFNIGGNATELAPATDGDLEITNHGDGTYTISFSFLDDRGHTFDGEWQGRMNTIDYSSVGKRPKKI